jgi:hypothetical protein
MDKWFKDILPDKDPYHNRGRDQMRKKGGSGIRERRAQVSSPKREERRLQIFILPTNHWWLEQTTSTRRLYHLTKRFQEPAGHTHRVPAGSPDYVREWPFNGLWLFFLSHKARIFSPEFNIRLYDKNFESDFFFFPPPKSEYFFQ